MHNSHSSACVTLQEWAKNVTAGKLSKGEKLGVVDHSTMTYAPFRRDFYIEVPELARMTDEEVAEYRKQLDDLKVSWHVALSVPVHDDQHAPCLLFSVSCSYLTPAIESLTKLTAGCIPSMLPVRIMRACPPACHCHGRSDWCSAVRLGWSAVSAGWCREHSINYW